MNIIEIIEKKKFGKELTYEEIEFFANAAADRKSSPVMDYQLSALLMAIRLMGMTGRETADLTMAMLRSGDVADLSAIPGIKVDKHSTGGVGDTVTLVVGPLVAACGGKVAKMSGRGLGHTGGTLDKLEAIPGFRVEQTEEDFVNIVNRTGLAVISQTGTLAPADKTLYALRDVTGTVDSMPLIASSIMSKKLASGSDAIVLDVKCGSGALMATLDDAITLAKAMVDIGTRCGRRVVAMVTGMDQPLGTHVGNALEVKDAIDVLSGRTQGDLLAVSLMLAEEMLLLSNLAEDHTDARAKLLHALHSGAGLEKLREMIRAQGGDDTVVDDWTIMGTAPVQLPIRAEKDGFVQKMETIALGMAAQHLGAGRLSKTDLIDPTVGFVLTARIGDEVKAGDVIGTVHARTQEAAEKAVQEMLQAITFGSEKVAAPATWLARVTKDGVEMNH